MQYRNMMNAQNADPLTLMGIELAKSWTSVLCLPLEYVLRPWYGTRYVHPFVTCVALLMLLVIPITTAILQFFPRLGVARLVTSEGLIGAGLFCTLFSLGTVVHNLRLWHRMIHPFDEINGEWEGPPLPIFNALPASDSWTRTRLVYEPVFCTLSIIVFYALGIIDRVVMLFLSVATVALFAKAFIVWYQSWLHLRIILDGQSFGAAMANLLAGGARPKPSDPRTAQAFVGIPSHLNPEAFKAVARHIIPDIEAMRAKPEPPSASRTQINLDEVDSIRSKPEPPRPNGYQTAL